MFLPCAFLLQLLEWGQWSWKYSPCFRAGAGLSVPAPGRCPLFPSGLSALHSAAAAVSRRKSEIFLVATFLINLSLHRLEPGIAAQLGMRHNVIIWNNTKLIYSATSHNSRSRRNTQTDWSLRTSKCGIWKARKNAWVRDKIYNIIWTPVCSLQSYIFLMHSALLVWFIY